MGRKYDIKFKRVSSAESQALMKSKVLLREEYLLMKSRMPGGRFCHDCEARKRSGAT